MPCLLAFHFTRLLYKRNRAIIIPNHPRTGMIRKNEFSLRICQQLLIFSYSLYESFHEFFHTNPLLSFQTDYESPMQKSRTRILFEPPCSAFLYHTTSFFSVQSLFYVTSINSSAFRDTSVFSTDCKSISSVPFRLI